MAVKILTGTKQLSWWWNKKFAFIANKYDMAQALVGPVTSVRIWRWCFQTAINLLTAFWGPVLWEFNTEKHLSHICIYSVIVLWSLIFILRSWNHNLQFIFKVQVPNKFRFQLLTCTCRSHQSCSGFPGFIFFSCSSFTSIIFSITSLYSSLSWLENNSRMNKF